ncbi:MAG: hypothetical protein M5R36_10300 [Deltaproteobacteria bacterium]|nr:hypothetical protein [Deltaproteobacteria bacterium]
MGGVAAAILAFIAGLWLLPEFAPTGVSLVLVGGFAAGFLATRAVPALRRALIGGKVIETEVRQRALQAFIETG